MFYIERIIHTALQEDIGSGDITTKYLIDKNKIGKGIIFAKENLVVAGLNIAHKVFKILDEDVAFLPKCSDGDEIKAGEILLQVNGSLSSILQGERTALNFLQRLSGIATKTREYVKKIEGSQTKLIDTRKTTPCWRILEKNAVSIGGGFNHRMGLYDGVLIKDNHITICGSISNAVNKIRKHVSHLLKIEVEVSSLDEVKEALRADVDIIMLDNMNVNQIKQAVKIINNKSLVEVSGNITLNQLEELGSIGIDFISVGAITHSATVVDLSMRIDPIN